MAGLFGWDLLFASVADDIKNEQDILVCFTHLVLVSNGFKCIGLGESKVLEGNEPKSESLPKGWNDDYAIRYVYNGRLYNMKATRLDDGVMINLVRVDERTVSLVQLNTRAVESCTGTLEQMIPDNQNYVSLIKKQLIDKVILSKKSKEVSSQTESNTRLDRPLRTSRSVESQPLGPIRYPQIPVNPGEYGRSDLDPFGGMDPLRPFPRNLPPIGGGGMLFQPPFAGPSTGPNMGIPPGSLPPGARFDPFRAPDERHPPRRPFRPDNDEMPPPGYDDMFM